MRTLRAPTILLGCLFIGLPIGGLRDPLLWTATAALIWLVALASPAPRSPSLKFWGLWLGWALISVLTCDQPLKSFYAFSRWLTLIAFFHVAAASWEERDSTRWLAGLAACALILGSGTLLLKGTVHPMTGLLPPYYNYTVFVEAAFFAAALGALGHKDGPAGGARWTLLGLMAFVLSLIVKTRSRSGLAAIAAAVLLWLIRRGRSRWLAWSLLALAAAAVLAPSRYAAYLLKLDMSAWFTRPQIWAAALKVAAEHPLLGEGLGNFEQGFLRHNFPKGWATNYGFSADHAHSEILEMAAATGWVGLCLFLTAWFYSLRPPSPQTARPTQEAALCALAAMAMPCLFDNMLHMPALGMLFLTALICAQSRAQSTGAIAMGNSAWRVLCGFGLVLSLASYVPQRLADRAWTRYGLEADPTRRVAIISQPIRLFPADYFLRETLARAWLDVRPPQTKRALEEIQTAARLNPTNALYPVMQATLALERGQRQAALLLLNRGLELEPNYLGARLLRAELWAKAGKKRAALRELDEITKRHELLRDLPPFSAYDRTIIYLDKPRLAAAGSLRKFSKDAARH